VKHLSYIILVMIGMMTACAPHSCVPQTSKTALILELMNGTAALVATDEDGDTHVFCTAVFVGEKSILTAAHCVRDGKRDVVGDTVDYVVQADITGVNKEPVRKYHSTVVKYDEAHDLALLRTEANVPYHTVIKVASFNPLVGEEVHCIGHKIGYTYSYNEGTVAAYRNENLRDKEGKLGPFLQLNAQIYFGNSGGGAFNNKGELVGIASFITRAPGMAFYIRAETIRSFLLIK
jgi:S1-C subfamily serine protease